MTATVTGQLKAAPVTFVLGGARSGKSAYAEALITASPGPWCYVATAVAIDDEMRDRIAVHRSRRGEGWRVVEEALDLPAALAAPEPVLVDCLTLWLTNLLMVERRPRWPALLAALDARTAPTVIVSNEVSLGVVPDNELSRAYLDVAGLLHQQIASRADRVVFMLAGLPMVVK